MVGYAQINANDTSQNNPNTINRTLPQQPPVNNNRAVPASGGTEPDNRVMLRSQTDSMDSKRNTPQSRSYMVDSTRIDPNRGKNVNPNLTAPPAGNTRRDSLK
jgi:hypothetical protein